MEFFTNFLTLLGEHYALVLVACAELVADVLPLSLRPRKRVRHALLNGSMRTMFPAKSLTNAFPECPGDTRTSKRS